KNILHLCKYNTKYEVVMKSNIGKFQAAHFGFEAGERQNKAVIWISFPYQQELVNHLKTYTKARWSATHKKWYVPDAAFYRTLFGIEPKYYSKSALDAIHPVNQDALDRYIEQLQLKGYSPNTIRTYVTEFSQLLKTIKSFPVNDLSAEKLRSYFLYCINELKLSESIIHSRMNAV